MTARGIYAAGVVMTGIGLSFTGPGPALAQEDFRAADLDRPIRVEDAMPVKLWEWETELGLRSERLAGENGLEGIAELKAGPFPNTQIGVELEGGWTGEGGGEGGLEGAGAHVFYNFNRETWRWPAFAARIDFESPGTGDFGRNGWATSVKGIATRSFDRLRIHANAGFTATDREDGGDTWSGGLAFDYPLGLFSRAILGDLYAESPEHGDTRLWAELGSRWQLTNRMVFDFGIATRLDALADGEGSVELIVGISRVFGIESLTPVPPYPDPRID